MGSDSETLDENIGVLDMYWMYVTKRRNGRQVDTSRN